MEALLTTTQTIAGAYPYWDFQVVGGIVPIITGTEEQAQNANVIAYTQKGLIPQAPAIGVNWTGLLVGNESPLGIDTDIVQGITLANLPYRPTYSLVKNNLIVNIVHQ
jgi:hypothetical protein